MEQASELTFKALNERIDAIPDHPSMSAGLTKAERYGYTAALLAWALSFLCAKLIPNESWSLIATTFFLGIELAAIAVIVISKWPPRLPTFRADRDEYAEQLDHDLRHYAQLVDWIVRFPRDQIAAMSDYADMRQDRFREKQPLLLGSIEKLGALPVLVAVYAQLKVLHFEISWPEAAFFLFLAWLYWLCLISIGTRHRSQFFAIVLKRALAAKDQRDDPDNAPMSGQPAP